MLGSILSLGVMLTLAADGVGWEKDYKKAFEKAGQLKVPVLVCFNMDGEWANDELANKIYRDPKFLAAASGCVCLVGSVFEHQKTADGMCSRFPSLTCADHKQVEKEARKQFVGGTVAIAPQHVLAASTGDVITRRAYMCTLDELCDMVKSAELALSGASATEIAKRVDENTEKQMKSLREQAKTHDWQKQFELLEQIAKLGPRPSRILFTELALDKSRPEDLRKRVIGRLGSKGDYDSLETLLKLAKDDDPDIAIAAAGALEVEELPQATETLLKVYKKKPCEALRCILLRALGACGGDLDEVRGILARAAHDSNAYVRSSAALGLGYVLAGLERGAKQEPSKSDREATETLLKMLGDSQGTVRGAAVYALGYARLPGAREPLEKIGKDDNAVDVRECAQAALKNLGEKGQTDLALTCFRWKFSSDLLR